MKRHKPKAHSWYWEGAISLSNKEIIQNHQEEKNTTEGKDETK